MEILIDEQQPDGLNITIKNIVVNTVDEALDVIKRAYRLKDPI